MRKVLLALLLTAVAHSQTVERSPDSVVIRGRTVPHSWSGGKVWISTEDAQNSLQYESKALRVDLLEALAAKGYSVEWQGGALVATRKEEVPGSFANQASFGSATDPSGIKSFSLYFDQRSGLFNIFMSDDLRDVTNLVSVDKRTLDALADAYIAGVTAAVSAAPGSAKTVWDVDVGAKHSVKVRGGCDSDGGLRWVSINLAEAGSAPVDFIVPVTWRAGSQLAPDHERAKAGFESVLGRGVAY